MNPSRGALSRLVVLGCGSIACVAGAASAGTPAFVASSFPGPLHPHRIAAGDLDGDLDLAAPLLGGVLLPSPDLFLPLAADAQGRFQAGLTWPSGLASGSTIYVQAWTPDPGGPHGYAATNAVSLITP